MSFSQSTLITVRTLEERAFNAWPAFQTVFTDGWIFRWADGYTNRANSANALDPVEPFAPILDAAEEFYARQGLPAVFRLSPLAGEKPESVLSHAGYRRFDETIVLVADLTSPMSSAVAGNLDNVGITVDIAPAPHPPWYDGFAEANHIPAASRTTHERMLGLLRLPAAFAVLRTGMTPVAYGFAVIERGLIGLFNVVTMPEARRRGYGRCLVNALLAWGKAQGATGAYLQVVATNTPALTLYDQFTFREKYRYHYRMR